MERLSTKRIESLEPRRTTYLVYDATVAPGFAVKVLPNGTKTYVIRYRVAKTQREKSIGRVNGMHLEFAKNEARKLYQSVCTGKDPVLDGQSMEHTKTVAELAADYMDYQRTRKPPVGQRTLVNWQIHIDKYIVPFLGKYLLGNTALEGKIASLHLTMAHIPAQANHVLTRLRHMFKFAAAQKWVSKNPVPDIAKHTEVGRNDSMSPAELAAIWDACARWTDREEIAGRKWFFFGLGFQLLVATGTRKSEILSLLRWDYITDDRITIPKGLVKTGKKMRGDLVIFQTDLTRAILAQVPRTCDYVFRINDKAASMSVIATCWRAIEAMAGFKKHYRIHDIRHSFASVANANETLTLKHVGMLLNHMSSKTTERYVHQFDGPKRKAAKDMGDTMAKLFKQEVEE